jgi:hypothetical protein
METAGPSETMAPIYQTIRCHIPVHPNLHTFSTCYPYITELQITLIQYLLTYMNDSTEQFSLSSISLLDRPEISLLCPQQQLTESFKPV